jgi:hypothetical protein
MNRPNFSGLWRLDPAKSRLVRVSKISMKIERRGTFCSGREDNV